MDAGAEPCSDFTSFLYLKSAFLAMEPAHFLISLARRAGGGSITTKVQTFILEDCIKDIVGKGTELNHKYIKNILQKLIVAVESTSDIVIEELYEKFAYYLTIQLDDQLLEENNRIYKQITFLLSLGQKCSSAMDLKVPLQCSLNMLEGDTGCALWPSSLFLSEFILSYQEVFSKKFCFEIGSGVGLVGIALLHVGASRVVLTDGDISTLANMKSNIELNHLDLPSERASAKSMVECKYLPWESASKRELQDYGPEIILGADVIYDPHCIPHLVRVLSALLSPTSSEPKGNGANCCGPTQDTDDVDKLLQNKEEEAPVAYIATVIRNQKTFDYFLRVAAESPLSVLDITEMMKPMFLLPYMLSYYRSSVHLLKVSFLCN
ncbi:hypothetical protein C4D60_Mb11t23540 [Musa balbisiana]|uniref:FAM86 N-terminal domain-containing protein n=1 Tax=Musa balbisiana TaxID=52838 RepID=A0A4S8J685_MUSBA|nr:hypothetical protein C4D60_Mb11t23540 [Musa balbisiana]